MKQSKAIQISLIVKERILKKNVFIEVNPFDYFYSVDIQELNNNSSLCFIYNPKLNKKFRYSILLNPSQDVFKICEINSSIRKPVLFEIKMNKFQSINTFLAKIDYYFNLLDQQTIKLYNDDLIDFLTKKFINKTSYTINSKIIEINKFNLELQANIKLIKYSISSIKIPKNSFVEIDETQNKIFIKTTTNKTLLGFNYNINLTSFFDIKKTLNRIYYSKKTAIAKIEKKQQQQSIYRN